MATATAQEEILKFWHGEHPLCAELERLEKQYIPDQGPSSSKEAEILRAATRLYYDYGTNGLCNNLTAETNYLKLVAQDLLGKKLCIFLEGVRKKILKWTDFDGPSVERQLEAVLEKAVQNMLVAEKAGKFTASPVSMDSLRDERH